MADLTAAVERHCELFNDCVRTGDWAPFTATFAEDARMAFTDVPVGPFVGRDQIAVAYAEQPPTDTMTLEAVETLDERTARVHFAWDASGDDGVMVLVWQAGRVAALEVTFGVRTAS
jgi:steroid delta-isomerase